MWKDKNADLVKASEYIDTGKLNEFLVEEGLINSERNANLNNVKEIDIIIEEDTPITSKKEKVISIDEI